MKFVTDRETLLRPLQLVTGVVERRQTLPVLANLLVKATSDGRLSVTGTDLEVELVAEVVGLAVEQEGEATIPARKLNDIWRSLPEGAEVSVHVEGDRAIVRSGRSRFSLATLPAGEFPRIDSGPGDVEIRLGKDDVRKLLDKVSFSMAQQDVRYFLNGMLLEVTEAHTRAVATDGHRLAMSTIGKGVNGVDRVQAIVPRKGVLELSRLLDGDDDEMTLSISDNHLRATLGMYRLTTKLVDGKFPDYEKVIPRDASRTIIGDRNTLRQAFHRASILSNEKYRGVRVLVEGEQMTIQANNPEQEEAEEIVSVQYDGEALEIGFNVSYLQDVLSVLSSDNVKLSVSDANSSTLIESPEDDEALYVVMPMRL
ncbi:MAG: DNA polymerase III subunit beta [Gammaproteobacteria bacterium]|nr:DNA polymerase III subunit beta [Gammaproteobacteria bacterium]